MTTYACAMTNVLSSTEWELVVLKLEEKGETEGGRRTEFMKILPVREFHEVACNVLND